MILLFSIFSDYLCIYICTLSSDRYDSEGKETSMASVGSGLSPSTKSGARSMYSDRVSISHITSNPSLGGDKVYIIINFHNKMVKMFLVLEF